MGQAKKRGTYKERVRQAQSKQTKSTAFQLKHEGMDYFFKNISQLDLKTICDVLNNMKRTMKGHTLVWKCNPKMKDTITCFYPPVPYEMEEMVWMLNKNREIGQGMVEAYNKARNTAIEYDGSEFYTKHDGDIDQFSDFVRQQFANLGNLVKETA